MSKHTLSVKDVAVICAMAKSQKVRTRREAWFAAKAAAERLKQASNNELELAPDVRTPMEVVVKILWKLFKTAKAQHVAAQEAERVQTQLPLESVGESEDAQLEALATAWGARLK
jgi:chromosome condensin MukBEF ATPase and DNA-binding subunit MukB